MTNTEKKVHEPLIHITKRASIVWWKAALIRLVAILFAFGVCAILSVSVTKLNPIEVFRAMFFGAFGSPSRISVTFRDVAILLCVALAVTPAFRMRFWNIGAEGQVLAGAIACAACMILLGKSLPNVVLLPLCLISAIAFGALWGAIPAFFKAQWNTNETLFTLMMNYVAMQFISFLMTKWERPKGSGTIGIINSANHAGWIPEISGNKDLVPIFIVLLLTAGMYIYLNYSKHGYEISVVGESENTARYIGIRVKKVIIRTMIISGAICGLAGFLLVSGTSHTLSTATAGGQGFTAIMVSWLAKFNPITMIATSLLLVFLSRGTGEITTQFKLNASFSEILTGVILFFIIGCEFFINYQVHFRKSQKEDKAK